jgi:hypothetical protein
MLGKVLTLFLMLFTVACAHPHYGDGASLQDQIQNQNQVCAFSFTGSISCAQLSWEKNQTEDETGTFTLHFGNLDTAKNLLLKDPAQILQVRLWMPSMGHGSSPLTVTKSAVGVYEVTGVWFSMPGQWEIQIKLQDENGVVSESSFALRY